LVHVRRFGKLGEEERFGKLGKMAPTFEGGNALCLCGASFVIDDRHPERRRARVPQRLFVAPHVSGRQDAPFMPMEWGKRRSWRGNGDDHVGSSKNLRT